MRVTAIVVTYNRKALLSRCLTSLMAQERAPDVVLIVDNASTDGTQQMLSDGGWLARHTVKVLPLLENTGGTGGFAAGMESASSAGCDWMWMMDDDAAPHPDALRNLLDRDLDPNNIYSSCAVSNNEFSWPVAFYRPDGSIGTACLRDVPTNPHVPHTPFLGILVSVQTAATIGYPDAGFFLGRDDVEYCIRARRSGAKIMLITNSLIEHPAAQLLPIRLPWRTLMEYKLPPWKRYYIARNRLLIAKKYYGLSTYYKTLPAMILRLGFVMASNEPHRWLQFKATVAGIVDGLMGRKGKRHELWGLGL